MPSNDVRNIEGFDFDNRGRIGFVRRDTPSQRTFVLISVEGKILREVTIPLGGELAKHGSPQAAWLAGERWVVVASGIGVEAKASAWWLDAANGEFEPVSGFDCPTIERVAGLRDGGFVALATKRLRYSREDSLIAFDGKGELRWEMKQGQAQVESSLFSPDDVTVTTEGRIAVIDVIRKKVQLFNMNGKFLSVIALETAWKRKPNYPSTISADRDDGLLIKDFRGNPPIVRMDRAGSVVGEFFPKHPDGRIIDAIGGIRVDSSGTPWACDGQALMRLRADGVSDRILGTAPSTEKLGRIAAVTVNQQGRIYAMDDRTGAVHIYDDAGAWLGVCKPDVTDFTDKIWDAQVAVRSDGTVFARGDTTRFIQFGLDRHRLGVKRIDVDTVTQHWYPLPNGDHTLIVGYHDAYIVDGAGEVIRTIQRRPNRNWLEQPRGASIAADGSFAIITGGGYADGKPWEVHLYTAAGEPIRTIEMPNACLSSFFVYTGKVLVTRTDHDLCVFTLAGAPILKSPVALSGFVDVNLRWQCFAPGARELWLVCAERKSVSRFELPKSKD